LIEVFSIADIELILQIPEYCYLKMLYWEHLRLNKLFNWWRDSVIKKFLNK